MPTESPPHLQELNLLTSLNDSGLDIDQSLEVIHTDADDVYEDTENIVDNLDFNHKDKPNNILLVNDSNELQVVHNETLKGKNNKGYRKPHRPCIFCNLPQSQLKRHILTKHKTEVQVIPILSMNSKEQDRQIAMFRKQGIKNHNVNVLKNGKVGDFTRERLSVELEVPIMCCGCNGFFAQNFKALHQLISPVFVDM